MMLYRKVPFIFLSNQHILIIIIAIKTSWMRKNYTRCIFIRASLFLIDISMQLVNISFSDHLRTQCLFLHLRNKVMIVMIFFGSTTVILHCSCFQVEKLQLNKVPCLSPHSASPLSPTPTPPPTPYHPHPPSPAPELGEVSQLIGEVRNRWALFSQLPLLFPLGSSWLHRTLSCFSGEQII